MVREKVKAKKVKLSQEQNHFLKEAGHLATSVHAIVKLQLLKNQFQCFSFGEDSNSDQELMELYEEKKTKENTSENNNSSLGTMLEAENISDASAQLEEYSQRYDDDDMAQCVPELVVYTPNEPKEKPTVNKPKQGPRMKFTPKRQRKETKRKIKPLKQPTSVSPQELKSESDDYDDFLKSKKEGTWIQCSKIDCLKWRKLPNNVEPYTIPERWVCAMNSDLSRTECAASQETCDSQLDFDVVYTPFIAGSLVWAKVPGYPWWPGMVEDDPDYNCCYETDDTNVNPISYHVSFIFDKDVSRSWVSYLSIRDFGGSENPNELGPKQKKYVKSLARALEQARSAMEMPLPERLSKYSFRVLYKGNIGYQSDEKPRKIKKRKQSKKLLLSPEDTTKKTNQKKKVKRTSLTDSENSITQSESMKKKVKKRKIILASSDEDDNGKSKEINTDGNEAQKMNNISQNADKKNDLVGEDSKRCQDTGNDERNKEREMDQVSADETNENNDSTHNGKEKPKKNKVKKKPKPVQTTNEVPKKKKRKSTSSDERKKTTPLLQEKSPSSTSDHSKDKLKKSKEKLTKSKKKTKFVNPVQDKSADTSNENNGDKHRKDAISFSERFMEELAKDTSTDSSMNDNLVFDTSYASTLDELNTDSNELYARLNELEDESAIEKTMKTYVKESSGRENLTFKLKKKTLQDKSIKDHCAGEDSGEVKGSVVKPKKFELAFGFKKKNKPTNEKKMKKIQKKNSKISGKENEAEYQRDFSSPEEMSVEGSSVKPKNPEQKHSKKNNKTKKVKQTVSKFKTPVKASSKVTPATKVKSKVDRSKKPSEESKKTLEEVLQIPSSDDPRKNPENYVSIDLLEKDISNLYQELSQHAAATNDLTDDDLTEASDCVTMEFLDRQISGNTGNPKKISMRQITDSPEF